VMSDNAETAVLAGGCAWVMQQLLRHPNGVTSTRVGWTGGEGDSPTEESPGGHAEAVEVLFDPERISYRDLLEAALDRLAEGVEGVYVHLDLDALDPAVGRGVVDPPVPGGLSPEQLAELLDHVRARFAVLATTIATYTPSNDDGSTLPIAIAAIRRLIDRT
jgi:arginase family enzyme